MKRTLIKLCVFVLAGATINVAVAWGCAIWGHQLRARAEESDQDEARRIWLTFKPTDRAIAIDWQVDGPPIRRAVEVFPRDFAYGLVTGDITEIQSGWPTRSLMG